MSAAGDIDNPVEVYLAPLAPKSQRCMRAAIAIVESLLCPHSARATFDWARVTRGHALAARAAITDRYGPAYVNRMLSAMRGVLKVAWRLGQLPADEYAVIEDLKHVKVDATPRGRVLSMGELRALFGACAADKRPRGFRDAALLAVLCMGLRRGEVVALDLSDYSTALKELCVRGDQRRKIRIVYAPPGCARALAAWLALRGHEPGPLFLPINRGDRMGSRRLHDQTVLNVVDLRAGQAGVSHFAAQDLRRTFIDGVLSRGDVVLAQQLVGHATPQTTVRYDQRRTHRRAPTLEVPYR